MKVVIQRSLNSKVITENEVVGEISKGMVLFVCLEKEDNLKTIEKAIKKICSLRIFEAPGSEKMDLSILESGGEILCVSQFTLSWNGKRGNRPSFDGSMEPNSAQVQFRLFCEKLREQGVHVEIGSFGKKMSVSIENDGPVTFCLEF